MGAAAAGASPRRRCTAVRITTCRRPAWFSANIGVHHVHHLSSGIPFYRLPEVLRDHPALGEVGRLSLWDSLACVRFALWDEDKGQLVSLREAAEWREANCRSAASVDMKVAIVSISWQRDRSVVTTF